MFARRRQIRWYGSLDISTFCVFILSVANFGVRHYVLQLSKGDIVSLGCCDNGNIQLNYTLLRWERLNRKYVTPKHSHNIPQRHSKSVLETQI